jgi:uncharacterized cupin superfamily protein
MAIDEQKVFADWEARGFSGGTMVDPPGKSWIGYVHAVDELIMLVEGELELEMLGEHQMLEVGREVLVKRHVLHSIRNKGEAEARWLYAYGK